MQERKAQVSVYSLFIDCGPRMDPSARFPATCPIISVTALYVPVKCMFSHLGALDKLIIYEHYSHDLLRETEVWGWVWVVCII